MYEFLANPSIKAGIVESRWSSFGRTDLVKSELLPNEMTLFVDGAAGSVMYNLDALRKNPQEAAHLTLHYGEFFPFLFIPETEKQSALIIGPGGGRDVVVALLGGAKSITAVEVNPDVVDIVKRYQDFNGGLYTRLPNVQVVVAEGRNYVRASDKRYDLIMLAIPITKSSRSVEGYALTENYLFTVEAFQDYLSHLTPQGRIIIVAHNNAEIYRLIFMAVEAFGSRGIPQADAMKRIYTVASEMMPAVVIKGEPLTPEEADAVHAGMHNLGFDMNSSYIPYVKQDTIPPNTRLDLEENQRMFDQILEEISAGKMSISALVHAANKDISPVTDNRPFFYKFERGLPNPFGAFAFLLVVAAVALSVLVFSRRRANTDTSTFRGALLEWPSLKLFLLLFSAIGVGYMLIEIAFFQKLMLFIGQPQLALTVLLFSLLLGSGFGSLASSLVRRNVYRVIGGIAIAVALATVLLALLFPRVFSLGLDPKAAAAAMLIPLGILMGFPFPLAVRLMDASGFGDHVYLMWGVNGIASVLGSALSMIVGIMGGFSNALFLGAILYACAAALALALPAGKARAARKNQRESAP